MSARTKGGHETPTPDLKDSEGFTDQPWCEECRIGRCHGEHSGFSRFTPATGGGARETFLGTDNALQVPCASVTPMFLEDLHFSDCDDAPYVALSVTAGAVSLRAHEARQLAEWLVRTAYLIEATK